MKNGFLYILLLFTFGTAVGFIVIKNKKKEETILPFKERTGLLANSDEYKANKKKAAALLAAIQQNPNDTKSKLELASLYIQEARITGNHVYYDKAALQLSNNVLKQDSTNFEALVFKGTIYLSQHHFADGLKIAQRIQQLNPYNAYVYGMLVDANVELGNYEAAVQNCDKMVATRPDIRSYSRISYLREIYGDYPGAIEAMKLAVSAGYPGDEGTEWARVHLGQLYENTGDLANAQMQYTISLQNRPDYAYAYAGLGRLFMANKNYPEEKKYLRKADSLVNDYGIKDELTDIYLLSGEKEQADANAKQVVEALAKDAQSGANDASIGHYSDRELAYAYLKTNEPAKALEHALLEYNRRPDNIDVNETLAWVYYYNNDVTNAEKYIVVALKTNSKNPTLLCRAGLIYARAGNTKKAKEIIQSALQINANINEQLKTEAQKLIQTV